VAKGLMKKGQRFIQAGMHVLISVISHFSKNIVDFLGKQCYDYFFVHNLPKSAIFLPVFIRAKTFTKSKHWSQKISTIP
jgi:hypothetical protein